MINKLKNILKIKFLKFDKRDLLNKYNLSVIENKNIFDYEILIPKNSYIRKTLRLKYSYYEINIYNNKSNIMDGKKYHPLEFAKEADLIESIKNLKDIAGFVENVQICIDLATMKVTQVWYDYKYKSKSVGILDFSIPLISGEHACGEYGLCKERY